MGMDAAYENAAHIPGGMDFPARWAADAAAFRASAKCALDLPYGERTREVFDLFHPSGPCKGTVIFVHGGYWLHFDKSYWSHLAAGPLAQGWAVAMLSYDLCPEVRISQITQQVAAAVGVIADRVPGPLRLVGHSAGGHLVARMICADQNHSWRERVARVMPVSPVAYLAPLMQTKMNTDLRIDAAEAAAESLVAYEVPDVPVTVWVGSLERPVFLEQAQLLTDRWGAEQVVVPGRHHFDIIDDLADPDSDMVARLLA